MAQKARSLTLKQKRFVQHYLESGNATEAAQRAGYSSTSRMSLGAQAYENLKKPQVLKAIEQALIRAEITPESIMLRLNRIAEYGERDSDRIKALENLAKIIELTGFKNNQHSGPVINGDISISFGLPKPIDRQYIDSQIVDAS